MNRFAVLFATGTVALFLTIALPSCGVLGGPPGNVLIQADETGAGVALSWTSPSEGPPDRYAVFFTPLGGSEELVAETTATICYHAPADGRTGSYRVEARYGSDSYSAAERPSTVPILTDTVRLDELNVDGGRAGFGWNRTTGRGAIYDMRQVGSAAHVDLYLTDTRHGSGSRPYALFSPAAHGKDSGATGVIPVADWKEGWFTDYLRDEQAVLPVLESVNYFDYTDMETVPFNAGCWLPDGHFALVTVTEVNPSEGYAKLVAWLQMVPGLRLMGR